MDRKCIHDQKKCYKDEKSQIYRGISGVVLDMHPNSGDRNPVNSSEPTTGQEQLPNFQSI